MVLSCYTRLPQYIYNLCTNILYGTTIDRSAPRPPKLSIALKHSDWRHWLLDVGGWRRMEKRKEQATAHDPPTLHRPRPAAENRPTWRTPNHTIYSASYSRSYSSRKRTCPTRRWTWTRTSSNRLPTTSRSRRACTAARRPWARARCWIGRHHRWVPVTTRLRPGTSTARSAARRRTARERLTSAGCHPKWRPWWPSSGDRPAFWPARNTLVPLCPAGYGCRGPDGRTVRSVRIAAGRIVVATTGCGRTGDESTTAARTTRRTGSATTDGAAAPAPGPGRYALLSGDDTRSIGGSRARVSLLSIVCSADGTILYYTAGTSIDV